MEGMPLGAVILQEAPLSLCTLCLLACQVSATVGDSGPSSCVRCYMHDVCQALLIPFVDSK